MSRLLAAIVLAALWCGPSFAQEWMKSASCRPKVDDYYPTKAIRLQEVGTVLVEFTVKAKGPPTDVVVVRSTAPGTLQEAAVRAISSMRCNPDQKWMESGGPERRIRTNVLFKLKGFDETAERLDPEADEVVFIGLQYLKQ